MTSTSSEVAPRTGAFRPALSRIAGAPALDAAVLPASGATTTAVALQKAAVAAIGTAYGSVARRVVRRPSGSASCTRLRVTAFFCCCDSSAGPTGASASSDVVVLPQSNPIPSSFAIRAGEILLPPLPFFAVL